MPPQANYCGKTKNSKNYKAGSSCSEPHRVMEEIRYIARAAVVKTVCRNAEGDAVSAKGV